MTFTEEPRVAILPDFPSIVDDRQLAAVELDRLAALGKIRWYEEGSYPPRPAGVPVPPDRKGR